MQENYELFRGVVVSIGGWTDKWLGRRKLKRALDRWVVNSRETGKQEPDMEHDWIPHQCGGCRFAALFDFNYGLCANELSPNDGKVIFEHGGCVNHSDYTLLKEKDGKE